VNEKEKAAYYRNYKSLYNKLTNTFRPKVEKALWEMIDQFLVHYRIQHHVTPDIIHSAPLKKALKRLCIVGGVSNATVVWKNIKKQVSKGTGNQNLRWSWVINEYLKKHGLEKVTIDITNTLKDQIKSAIIKGQKAGLGVDEIVRSIEDSSFPKWMAARIVRTELNQVMNTGAMVAAADSNIVLNKQWLSTLDNRTRRIPRDQYDHLHMDGTQVTFSDKFIVPSTKTVDAMLYPGDPSASIGNLANCRCTVVFVPARDSNGLPIRIHQNQPSIDNSVAQTEKPVHQVPAGSTYSVFHELLRTAAEIGVTQFIVNQMLNEDSDKN